MKRIKVELELLTDIDLLLMAQKGIRGEIYHSINRYAKVNNKYMEDYNKIKELSYLKYWHVNNFYGCECLKSWQQMVLNGLKKPLNLIFHKKL